MYLFVRFTRTQMLYLKKMSLPEGTLKQQAINQNRPFFLIPNPYCNNVIPKNDLLPQMTFMQINRPFGLWFFAPLPRLNKDVELNIARLLSVLLMTS